MKALKEDGLYRDMATPHQAGVVFNILRKERVKSKFTRGISPDLMPIENAFGQINQILEERRTKTLKQLRTTKSTDTNSYSK